MAEHSTIRSLGCEVIEDFLMAAGVCIETRKADGGILGYPGALILLAVTDAIGHGLDVGSGDTRLAVLQHPPFSEKLDQFGQSLNNRHVKNLTQWYRHMLAHSGLIAPGVALTPEREGAPFGFSNEELTFIRIPVLYQLIRDVWGELAHTFTPRFRPRQEQGWPNNPAILGVISAVSGIVEPAIVAAIKGQTFT
jgi:hypothetical protein